jgi:hypothetical protein
LLKIVLTKINALFLAFVLVTGTIAAIFPSFMTGADAQAQTYYGKDNRDKSTKDSSKSVSLNKIKCINNNLNINGNNAGDVNADNKGKGYFGADSDGGYYDGYGNNKQDKGFDDCVINNNNTNTNIISGGNQTIPPSCEECFTENIINEVQLTNFTGTLAVYTEFGDLEGLCEFLSDPTFTNNEKIAQLSLIFSRTNIPTDIRLSIFECLDERRIIVFP